MSEALCRHCDSGLPGDMCTCNPNGDRDSQRPTLTDLEPSSEVAASIERNSTALLLEVAPHALHGLGLAIFKAFDRGIGHEAHALEQLKAKLEDWVAANR